MPGPERLLICALSGRVLAQSAKACGFAPIVLDRFADLDTAAAAVALAAVPAGRGHPFARRTLLRAAATLAPPPIPLVWGGGFDGAPDLLAALARDRELLGNSPGVARRISDPAVLGAECARLGVPFPETSAALPPDRDGWLVKRRGGSGGAHVRDAALVPTLLAGDYVQRRVAGRPVSLLLLGWGAGCAVLISSEQWHAGASRRFTGVVAPASLAEPLGRKLGAAARDIVAGFGLRGLVSVDFLVADDGFFLLEINARPGGSVEAAELALGTRLAALHVAACRGTIGADMPAPRPGVAATAIVWADRDLVVRDDLDWPDWAGDRTPSGRLVCAGSPLATVRAQAPDIEAARVLLAERSTALLAAVGAWGGAGAALGSSHGSEVAS